MAKLQSSEIVGVANRPATICSNTMCIWFDTTNLKTVISYCGYSGAGTWSAGGALITGRGYIKGAGTQNEAFVAGGYTNGQLSCTEEYNGTSWAAGGALITARLGLTGAGTQNETFVTAGYTNSSASVSCTEEYNGTSWSVGTALITPRYTFAGAGSQGAGLVAGGVTNVILSCTEEYLKSSYTIVDCIL